MEQYNSQNGQSFNPQGGQEQTPQQFDHQQRAQQQYVPQNPQQSQYDAQTGEINPIYLGKFRPLSAWAYFGYMVLFNIPLIGFICLIIFSIDDSNRNRRSFARSYWCAILVAIILCVIGYIIFGQAFIQAFDKVMKSMP